MCADLNYDFYEGDDEDLSGLLTQHEEPPPSPDAASPVRQAVASGASTTQRRAQASTLQLAVQQRAPGEGGSRSNRGQRAGSPAPRALVWSRPLVDELFQLRYKTFGNMFANARNKAAVHAAWVGLAKELSNETDAVVTARQCQNKMKALKKRWAQYKRERNLTGNDVDHRRDDPPDLETMLLYWQTSRGMDAESLFDDAHGRHHADENELAGLARGADGGNTGAEEAQEQPVAAQRGGKSSRHSKTTAEALESGLGLLSEGLVAMGESVGAASSVGPQLEALTTAIQAQQNSLAEQTASLNALVALVSSTLLHNSEESD